MNTNKLIAFVILGVALVAAGSAGYEIYVGQTLAVEDSKARDFIRRLKAVQIAYKANTGSYGNLAQLAEAKAINSSQLSNKTLGFQYEIKVSGDKYEASAICTHPRRSVIYLTNETGHIRMRRPSDDGSIVDIPLN